MPKTEPNSLIRFGVFEVDPRTGELRSKGSRVKLQDQPLQILLALLEKPGEVVTREELRAKLWPADTFVDWGGRGLFKQCCDEKRRGKSSTTD